MYKLYLTVILVILLNSITFSQMPDRTAYYSYGTQLYAESHLLPTNINDSADVLVIFRIMYDALTFTQINPLQNKGSFVAVGNFEAIFRDSDGIIRKRATFSDTVYVDKFEETNSKNRYLLGQLFVTLPLSKYKIIVQMNDKMLKTDFKQELEINATKNFKSKESFGSILFGYSPNKDDKSIFSPSVLGNNLSFTSSNSRILIPVSYKSGYESFNYTIKKLDSENSKYWDEPVSLSGKAGFISNSILDFDYKSTRNEFIYKISNRENSNSEIKSGIIDIEIPANVFVPGKYELSVFNESNRDSMSNKFEVIWDDMPLSFKTVDYAIRSMYHILTDEEFDNIDSGSEINKFKKILNYWKLKDPTPNTPYNEAMTEYFRRVDYAYFNFQTIREKDGSKTERGKVYILYGQADDISSNLKDGTTTEIWHYKKLNKTFTFSIVSNGIYKLIDMK